MFRHAHYVPLMRVKPAELRALRDIDASLRSRITPLLEFTPRTLRTCRSLRQLEARLGHIVSHLKGWSGRTLFLDFTTACPIVPDSVEVMAAQAAKSGIQPVLVVSLKTDPSSAYARATRAVLDRHGSTICLRISPEELKSTSIDRAIQDCLGEYGVVPRQVDLIVDRGGVDSGSVKYQEFAHLIPSINSWRTLTVLAGSFPKDLSCLTRGKSHRLRRFEWRQWRELDDWPGRRPAFGDYTIQHVYDKTPVPAPNPSASVRYTVESEFVVLRGEGIYNEGGPGPRQWNAWAMLLIEKPEFFGASFSAGDGYIAERASDLLKSGTPQTWLQAGFSHHLTTVALQVAGQLEAAREVSAVAGNWASIVDIDQPEANI